MKKVFPLLLTLTVFSGFFIFWRLAPSEKDITPSLSIAEASIFMDSKTERTLTFETTLDQDELRWYSSDPALLTVKDGNLMALKAGQVTVWVTTEDASLYDSVTIEIEEAILLSVPLPSQPEVPVHPVEPEAPVEPELEVTAEPEPEVPGVEDPEEKVVTPPTIYTVTITNETGAVITTLEVEEGSFITTSSIELPDTFKGFYLEGETCEDEPFDLETPITENVTLIEASFNDQAPCLQLDYIILSGRPVAGTELKVDIFPIGANVTISWYTSVNNRTYREIPGESGSTFTVRPEDSGKFIRVYVVSDSNPPVVRYDTAKLDVFKTVESEPTCKIILTATDLIAIYQNLAGCYELGANIDLSGYTDLTQSFINGTFTGTLNGSGFSILNLTINSSQDYIGLFSFISGASISDLTLNTFDITGHNRVGSLAGRSTNATLNQLQLSQITVSGNYYVGGLMGTSDNDTLLNTVITDTTVFGSWHIGGMVGFENSTSINNSVMTNTTVSGTARVGGLVGYIFRSASSSITHSTLSSITVTGSQSVGGLVGSIHLSFVTILGAFIEGSINSDRDAGGIVGTGNATITNASFTGTRNGVAYTYPNP